jgi:hypothetical protein
MLEEVIFSFELHHFVANSRCRYFDLWLKPIYLVRRNRCSSISRNKIICMASPERFALLIFELPKSSNIAQKIIVFSIVLQSCTPLNCHLICYCCETI